MLAGLLAMVRRLWGVPREQTEVHLANTSSFKCLHTSWSGALHHMDGSLYLMVFAAFCMLPARGGLAHITEGWGA